MSGTKPRSGPPQRDDWIRRHAAGRERPWALEEQLLGPSRAPERERRLAALTARMLEERTCLTRLREEFEERVARLAALEEELQDLVGHGSFAEDQPETSTEAGADLDTISMVELGASDGLTEREYWLRRCHGFRVACGEHDVGFVEGVRYGSSVTRPDTIEVRAGHFGRLLLVPVDDVADVFEDDETLVVRAGAIEEPDIAHALLARLRGRFQNEVVT